MRLANAFVGWVVGGQFKQPYFIIVPDLQVKGVPMADTTAFNTIAAQTGGGG
ncbi:hypothetical protein AGMMS50229_14460 [Campylobacterota bacterium]|nr:hypothetical protein AGMMS50229_14460 [Campylobacterota bacterium]